MRWRVMLVVSLFFGQNQLLEAVVQHQQQGGTISHCTCLPATLCQPLDTPHPSREIFGSYIHDRTVPHLNYSALTTLFIGPPATLDPAVICAAHAHGVRVISSVGFPGALLGPPGPFDPAQYTVSPALRASWVRHVMYGNGSSSSPGVATSGLDGVLVDIEKYKGNRSMLTALIADLGTALKAWHPSSQLSFALAVSPGSQSEFYDHLALSRLIDYIFVMCYDEWPFESWPKGTKVAAANSDLRTLYTAVASYKALGVSPNKLVMGLPWYGYDFPCDDNKTAAGLLPPEGAPCLASGAGKTPIKERAVLDQLRHMPSSPTMFRDNASATLYFDFQCTNKSKECPSGRANTGAFLGRHQIWYDDATTLRQKYNACREMGVLGVGVYALDFVSYEVDQQGSANWAALTDVWPRPAQTEDDASTAVPVVVSFGAPVVVGSSNHTHFYFPAVAVALGDGRVAQHVTLCDDSASCSRNCAQVWQSTGSNQTPFQLAKTVHEGGSGSFNFYGDLGERLPPAAGSASASGFVTLVGNNGGSWLGHTIFLQHWAQTATGGLRVVENRSAFLRGTPAAFSGKCGSAPPTECGLGQGGKIVRMSDGTLLAAFGGFANDSPTTCKPGYAWARCYVLAMFRSRDDGVHWDYVTRIDQTPAMPTTVEGPCEPTLCLLKDGRVLLVFRLQSGSHLWQAYSDDGGAHWSEPTANAAWAVWPQLLLLSNGVLLLSSGRPGLGLWISHDGSGASWDEFHNIASEHNRHYPPPSPLAFSQLAANVSASSSRESNPPQTTSYTSLVEIAPNVAHLAYDRLRVGCPLGKTEKWCQQHGQHGYDGGTDYVFAMRIEIQKRSQTVPEPQAPLLEERRHTYDPR